jgi:hypothetical protein
MVGRRIRKTVFLPETWNLKSWNGLSEPLYPFPYEHDGDGCDDEAEDAGEGLDDAFAEEPEDEAGEEKDGPANYDIEDEGYEVIIEGVLVPDDHGGGEDRRAGEKGYTQGHDAEETRSPRRARIGRG